MLIRPLDFSYLFGTLRGISDRALGAHLAIYRQAVDRLNAIEQAYPLVEWRAAGTPDGGDVITSAILAAPVAKLDLRPIGPLAECLAQVENDLAIRGISFRPAWYLGVSNDDFWTIDRAISVNIPWCFANPSLWRLANRSRYTAYTPEQMVRTLRHEAGHALLYAFELWRRPDWQAVFGDSRKPYLEEYVAQDGSRDFVEYTVNVRPHYGQKHPDEDWSETFACWLEPAANWRQQYADWPGALRKLEYIDALAQAGQMAGTPPNLYLGRRTPYQQTPGTVAQALEVGTALPATGAPGAWSEHAAMLLAESDAYNDVLLHEAHFGSLWGGGQPAPERLVAAAMDNWGSWESYLLDLRLCCAAGKGWALTIWDERRGMMRNAVVQPGAAVPVGCRVLLAIDLFEHAYALDYGIGKHLGVAAQTENVDWLAVAGRLPEIQLALAHLGGEPVLIGEVINPVAEEGEAEHRGAGREGLIAVEREVKRMGKTHTQTYWILPEERIPTDRILDKNESSKSESAPRLFGPGKPEHLKPAMEYAEKAGDEWRRGLSSDERKTMKRYTDADYDDINRVLRAGKEPKAQIKKDVERLDAAINRSALPDSIVVHRFGFAPPENLQVGAGLKDHAYVSTSLLPSVPKKFAQDAWEAPDPKTQNMMPTLWHIHLPKGTKAALPDGESDHPKECEVLLPRGSSFRVKSVGKTKIGNLQVAIVDAELVP